MRGGYYGTKPTTLLFVEGPIDAELSR